MPQPLSATDRQMYLPGAREVRCGPSMVRQVAEIGQCAAVGHRIARVHAQVENRHFELIGIGVGRRQLVLDVEDYPYLRSRRAVDESADLFHEHSNMHGHGLERLPARERQQALHQQLGALSGLHGVHNEPLLPLTPHAAPVQQIQAADDRHQQVVEVVGYATRELTHGIKLLRLMQSLLGVLSIRQLERLRDDGHHQPTAVADRPERKIKPPPAADRKIHMDFLAHDAAGRGSLHRGANGLRQTRRGG